MTSVGPARCLSASCSSRTTTSSARRSSFLLDLQAGHRGGRRVADGDEAVAACREHRPDVVLMDYRLPGLDGVAGDARRPRGLPGRCGRLPDRVGDPREVDALYEARVPCAASRKDQALEEIVEAIRMAVAARHR